MQEALITAIVFTAIYQIIKVITDFVLKKRMINTGNIDKTDILSPVDNNEKNSYPTLKWGLVALFAGLGMVIIEFVGFNEIFDFHSRGNHSYLPYGIELISISAGFLVYFFIVQSRSKE